MADKLYKVGEAIDLNYQAPNKQTGQIVIAEIFLPDKTKNLGVFPDVTLAEVGATGTYCSVFTPNAQGTWQVLMHKADGDGQVAKSFSVGAKNIQDIYTDTAKESTVAKDDTVAKATGLTAVASQVTNLDGDVATLDGKVVTVDNKVEALEAVIGNVNSQTGSVGEGVDIIIDKVNAIDTKVGALDTPAMAF